MGTSRSLRDYVRLSCLLEAVIAVLTRVGCMHIPADVDLKRTLQSLACGKKRVLRKVPAGRDVDDSDSFYFNADFTDPRPKVHITSIQAKETVRASSLFSGSHL